MDLLPTLGLRPDRSGLDESEDAAETLPIAAKIAGKWEAWQHREGHPCDAFGCLSCILYCLKCCHHCHRNLLKGERASCSDLNLKAFGGFWPPRKCLREVHYREWGESHRSLDGPMLRSLSLRSHFKRSTFMRWLAVEIECDGKYKRPGQKESSQNVRAFLVSHGSSFA